MFNLGARVRHTSSAQQAVNCAAQKSELPALYVLSCACATDSRCAQHWYFASTARNRRRRLLVNCVAAALPEEEEEAIAVMAKTMAEGQKAPAAQHTRSGGSDARKWLVAAAAALLSRSFAALANANAARIVSWRRVASRCKAAVAGARATRALSLGGSLFSIIWPLYL